MYSTPRVSRITFIDRQLLAATQTIDEELQHEHEWVYPEPRYHHGREGLLVVL
jgi:hypothetical protein